LGNRADEVTSSSFLLRAAGAAAMSPREQTCTAAQEAKFQRRSGPGGNVNVTEFYASLYLAIITTERWTSTALEAVFRQHEIRKKNFSS